MLMTHETAAPDAPASMMRMERQDTRSLVPMSEAEYGSRERALLPPMQRSSSPIQPHAGSR